MISIILLLLFSLIAFTACLDQEKKFKFPIKSKQVLSGIEGAFSSISGVAVSPTTDEIYFCDEALNQIFKISGEQQFLVAGAGGNPGHRDGHVLAAKFNYPQGISFHPNGSLLAIADSDNHVIRLIDLVRGTVSTLAGVPGKSGLEVGTGSKAKFNEPNDVAFDASSIYVNDRKNRLIKSISLISGNVTIIAGKTTVKNECSFANGLAINVTICEPNAMFLDSDENLLYFTDAKTFSIRVLNISSGYLTTVIKNSDFLIRPWGLVKRNNSILVADYVSNCIFSIDMKSKSLQLYAGSIGFPGFYNGLRLDAQFSRPLFMALSKSKDLLITDYFNTAIRIVFQSSGLTSTYLQQRGMGYVDGLPALARFAFAYSIEYDSKRRCLYLADTINNVIRRFHIGDGFRVDTLAGKPYSGFKDGSITDALFNFPSYVLMDPFNFNALYICDYENDAIRSIDLVAGLVSTVIKNVDKPISMDFDDDGQLFVSSEYLYQILLYQLNSSESPIQIGSSNDDCSDGPASTASITSIYGMSFLKSSDELLFADYYCNAIRSFSPSNSTIQTIAGLSGYESSGFQDGIGTDALFNGPCGISRNGSIIYIAEYTNCAVRRLNLSDMSVTTLAGNGELGYRNGHHSLAHFSWPSDAIAVQSEVESVFVVDSYNNAIRVIKDGLVTTIAGHGSRIYNFSNTVPVSLEGPCSILALDVNDLIIADRINNCIIKAKIGADRISMDLEVFAGDGSYGWLDGVRTDAMLNGPADMVFNEDRSSIFIADSNNHLIRKLQLSTGELSTFAGTGYEGNEIKPEFLASSFSRPQAITMDLKSGGVLYVADSGNNCIKRINGSAISVWAGSVTAGFKNGVSISALFANPMGIVYDPANLVLYVADTFNHAVRKIDSRRVVSTIVGVKGASGYLDGNLLYATFSYPTKITLGRSIGELLILDSANHAVRAIDEIQGVTSTLIHDGNSIFHGLALDDEKNIYISGANDITILFNTPIGTKQSRTDIIVILLIGIGLASILAVAILVAKYRKLMKPGAKTVDILLSLSSKSKAVPKSDQSTTLATTIALAIPGYLQVNLGKTISIPADTLVSGKGGTARVIKCKLKDTKLIEKHGTDDVAVKFFSKDSKKESFLYEVMIMSVLPKSPNLIELIGYSEGRRLVIIMKSYPMSLRHLVASKSFPSTAETNSKISADIANGMNLIHQKGIVHFDLKPANVLVEFSTSGIVNCVICDFGFANFVSDIQDKIVRGVKKPSAIGITVQYAAPELFAKINENFLKSTAQTPGEMEKKIDVYAYAMTLFVVYMGETPWKDLMAFEIESAIADGERPQLSSTVPRKMQDLIKVCWSQSPSERYSFSKILEILCC